MTCIVQERLLQEERDAWAAYHKLKDSSEQDNDLIRRRHNNACGATERLRLHSERCPNCKTGSTPHPK